MSKLRVVGVIPARMGSSRFPGKPLLKIFGLPMVEHVRRRAELSKAADEVIVATCDNEIEVAIKEFGGHVIMTDPNHERATDRIEEAVRNIDCDIVINIQGDEPMVTGEQLKALVEPFSNKEVECTCLVYPIQNKSDLSNDNIVKTVLSKSHRLLYLSRSAIPGREHNSNTKYYKQSGLMAFRKKFLTEFSQLIPTPLEKQESVDLLRILEHDRFVQGVVSIKETNGIDVPDQVKQVEEAILNDPVQREYLDKVLKWKNSHD